MMMENAINKALMLDVNSANFLSQHDGQVIKIEITDLGVLFYCIIRGGKIYLYTVSNHSVATTIRGSSLNYLKQLTNPQSRSDLTIEGDIELAYDFQQLLREFDINWQERLSYLIGDAGTERLNQYLTSFVSHTKKIKQRSIEDFKEYLQEEKRLLPTCEEAEDFYEELRELQYDIDRLEAKLKLVRKQLRNETN